MSQPDPNAPEKTLPPQTAASSDFTPAASAGVEESFPRPAKKRRHRRKKKKEDRRKLAAIHELKQTIAILVIVAAAASLIGWLAITRCEFGGIFERPDMFRSMRRTASDEVVRLTAQLSDASVSCFTAAEANQFFIAEGETVSRCRVEYRNQQLTAARLWTRNFEKKVTALYYVSGKTPLTGLLLVALGNRIETVNPEQNEGGGSLFAELEPESAVVSLASDFVSVFAADAGKRRIVRFSMLGEQNLTLGENAAAEESMADDSTAEDKEIENNGAENNHTENDRAKNDAAEERSTEEISAENSAAGDGEGERFPGFDLGELGTFSIDYSLADKMLHASNPGQFRVEAFDPVSGRWMPEFSWGKNPHDRGGFYPGANPALLTIFPEGSIVTVENGPKPRIRLFHTDGTAFSVLDDPVLDSAQTGTPFIQMGPSQRGLGQVYLLTPKGNLTLFTIPDAAASPNVPNIPKTSNSLEAPMPPGGTANGN